LRDEHGAKVTFIESLREAGLLATRPSDDCAQAERLQRGSNFGGSFSATSRS
jgi:hypothetical protein